MKIVGLCQSFNEREKGHFKFLEEYLKWIDEIIFLDDCSEDDTQEYIQGLMEPNFHVKEPDENFSIIIDGKIKGKKFYYRCNRENNWNKQKETTNKKLLLEEALKHNPDWIVSFDMDERYEKKWLKDYKKVLEYCQRKGINSLCFWWINLWLNEGWYRIDSGLSNISPPRIWRNCGSQTIRESSGLHQQLWPDIANQKVLQDYCLIHYSSSSKEKLKEKIKNYMKLDKTRDYTGVFDGVKLKKCKKEWNCKEELLPDFKIHKEILEELRES